jgi:hypothetical protein
MFQITNFDPKSAENRFEFQVPRRRPWHRPVESIPFLQYVPIAVMKRARDADKPMQLVEICELLGERRAAKAIRRLNQPEIAQLEKAWLDASVVGLGELTASLS